MSFSKAISYVAATKKSAHPTLFITCSVKPGASKSREGVTSISENAVEICVSARAREGEANKAVIQVLSEALKLPKSDLQITQGHKSRIKTIAAVGSWVDADAEACLKKVQEYLAEAAGED